MWSRRGALSGLPVFRVDGASLSTFEDFVRAFSELLDDFEWRGSLDAFNDILRGGCGTPDGGFVFRWVNADQARSALGYSETVRWLEHKLQTCHPTNRERVAAELNDARQARGPTLFDIIVGIIADHGPGGQEPDSNVLLELR